MATDDPTLASALRALLSATEFVASNHDILSGTDAIACEKELRLARQGAEQALQAYIAAKDQAVRVDLAAATWPSLSADWKPEGAVVSGGGQRFVALTNDGGKTWTPLRAIPDDVAPDTRSDKEAP